MMSDKSQVLCKYHVAGVCRFGQECAFSHNLSDLPSQVCKYYLAGCCAYGDRCRYDHKRPDYWKAKQQQQQQAGGPGPGSSNPQQRHHQHHHHHHQQQQRSHTDVRDGRTSHHVATTSGPTTSNGGGGSSSNSSSSSSPGAATARRAARVADSWDSPDPHWPAAAASAAGGWRPGRSPRAAGAGSTARKASGMAASTAVTTPSPGAAPTRAAVSRGAANGGQPAVGTAGTANCGAQPQVLSADEELRMRRSWEELGLVEARGSWADEVEEEERHARQEYAEEYEYGEEGDGTDAFEPYSRGGDNAAAAEDEDEEDEAGGGEEESEDAEAADVAGTSGWAAREEGLVMVDDDVGLVAEACALARRGRDVPAAAAAAAAGGTSIWAADRHPWEHSDSSGGGEGGDANGTAVGAGAAAAAAVRVVARAPRDPVDPAELDLCPQFALRGQCPEGDDCALVHGLECEICHKFWIHPYNADSAAEHTASCRLRHERLEARLRSSEVECGICLEPVLSKPSVSDRRFGLMSCDHPFCLSCIRSWRERTTDTSLATDTAVRTCPICRTPTHFVTPSLVWPATEEEKSTIVDAYKAKLGSIDCRHFDFGDGKCPFSTSCFYRHVYRDGRLEEPTLRRAGNADGNVRVVMPVRLSAFFDTPQAQRLLTRRR